MKKAIKYFLPLVLVSSSILVYSTIRHQAQEITDTDNNSTDSSIGGSQDSQLNQTIAYHKLSVLPQKCRGCGKCVRIDPQHFEMSGRTAVVISSTDLDSSALNLAINNCPTGAIILG